MKTLTGDDYHLRQREGTDATVTAIRKAREANVTTFLIECEINASGVAISQIVTNNYQGAKGVAEAFVRVRSMKLSTNIPI